MVFGTLAMSITNLEKMPIKTTYHDLVYEKYTYYFNYVVVFFQLDIRPLDMRNDMPIAKQNHSIEIRVSNIYIYINCVITLTK